MRCTIRCGLLGLLIFLRSQPGEAAEISGLISAESAPSYAPQFEANLVDALRAVKLEAVLTPAQFRARLTRAEEIAATLHQAKILLQSADQAMLNMNRMRAIRATREGIAHLQKINARYHSPELLARAYNMLALALLFRPADTIGALQAYKEAVKVAPGWQPDMDRTPPRALKLLLQAKKDPRAVHVPSTEELRWLAGRADIDQLIWIMGSTDDQKSKLELLIFSAKEGAIITHLHQEIAPAEMAQQGAKMINEALHPPAPASAKAPLPPIAPVAGPPVETTKKKASMPTPRPWYKKWWVWTIAGAVVGGTAVALALSLGNKTTSPPDNSYPNFIFKF